jgi:hypothetical protein
VVKKASSSRRRKKQIQGSEHACDGKNLVPDKAEEIIPKPHF